MESVNERNAVLKRRLNTFKSEKGALRDVSTELVFEVLRAWENWTGKTSALYRELGLSKMQMVTMIQKAKRLVKQGVVQESEFKEISTSIVSAPLASGSGIEVVVEGGRVVRFGQIDQVIEFLKKAG